MAGSLGTLFSSSSFPAVASAATTGLGEVGNLLAGHAATKQANNLENQEKAITNLTPAQVTAQVTQGEAPISNALVQSINNSVQGDVASRGLAQAPGIFASEEAQALAPYAQQDYTTALQQWMAKNNIPIEYASAISKFLPGTQNLTPSMALMLQQFAKLKSTNAGNGGTFTPASQPDLSQLTGIDPSTQASPAAGGIDPSLLTSLITQGAGA